MGTVKFSYPADEGDMHSTLLDRVVFFGSEYGSIVYWNMIDLIRFQEEAENWLRMTYYRYNKEKRRWIFAGQTSLSDPISFFEEMFVKSIKEKEWMRNLFKKIGERCRKELNKEQVILDGAKSTL